MKRLTEEKIKRILIRCEAILDGHFVLKRRGPDDDFSNTPGCGDHSGTYVNNDKLFPRANVNEKLGTQIALRFVNDGPEVVVGLALGTITTAAYTRDSLCDLGFGDSVCAVYAEGSEGRKVFKRGFDELIPKRRILIVEDIITTGKSAKAVVDAVELLGGNVIGVALICNSGGVTAENLGVPRLESLVTLTGEELRKWPMGECPLCDEGVPINPTPGHGEEFLKVRDTDIISTLRK